MSYSVQNSFAAGELAPTLWGRSDLAKYSVGLKKCENFVVRPHGGVVKRAGTKIITTSKKPCRLVPFVFNDAGSCILEFSDKSIRVFHIDKDGNPVLVKPDIDPSNGVVKLNSDKDGYLTPYSQDEVGELGFTQSGNTLYIVHKFHHPAMFQRVVTTLESKEDSCWTLKDVPFRSYPYIAQGKLEEDDKLYIGATEGSTTVSVKDYGEVLDNESNRSERPLFSPSDIGRHIELTQQVEEEHHKIDNGIFGRTTKSIFVVSYPDSYNRWAVHFGGNNVNWVPGQWVEVNCDCSDGCGGDDIDCGGDGE